MAIPGGSRRTRTSSSSPARRPASRRSARATGATGRGPRRTAWVYDETANAGWAHGRWRRSRSSRYYDICTVAGAGGVLPGRPELHEERHAGRPVRHAADHLAERDREPVERVERRLAVDDGAGVLHLDRLRARCSSTCTDSALQRTRYRELSPVGECAQLRAHRSPRARPHRGRPLGEPAHQHAAPAGVLADLLHARRVPRRATRCPGTAARARRRCARRCRNAAAPARRPGWTAACTTQATAVCQDRRRAVAGGQGVAARSCPTTTSRSIRSTCSGRRARCCASTASAAASSSATISGWACDPEWPGASVAVAGLRRRAPRTGRHVCSGEVRADQALATPLAREVSAACDGPGRTYARHGFSFTLPSDQAGNVFVYAIDESTANGPAAPPTLIRNGIVHVPALRAQRARRGRGAVRELQHLRRQRLRRRHARRLLHVAWTDECAAAADACAPADSSAPANSRVVRGGDHRLDRGARRPAPTCSSRRSSRAGCSSTAPRCSTGSRPRPARRSGSITLAAGQKYHLRWDRFQAEPPLGYAGAGLDLAAAGRPSARRRSRPANLYAIAPGERRPG